ncbi:putative crocetin glucosyltransferase [Medicago truncatula]|uniref:Putative crocetin glucosyltransferase n=1 Tax=Medicago truncatula TaxID=3880 RepID=A0A072VCH0_MEDTR|nr:hypothetical protein MTR_2g098425 [Medicago truncatula]RHN76167.1 putative crocetin glucosyltransferase [Medicago truncatula]
MTKTNTTNNGRKAIYNPILIHGTRSHDIIPFLALALNLEQKSKNYSITTIINTPHNIQKLQPSLPPNSYINFLTIPFISSDHNLPLNTENIETVPCNLVIKRIQTSLSLKPSFKNIIQNIITKQTQNQNHKLCIIGPVNLSDSWNIRYNMTVYAFCVSSMVIIDFFDRNNLRNWKSRSTKVVQDATTIRVVVAPTTKQAIHMCGNW